MASPAPRFQKEAHVFRILALIAVLAAARPASATPVAVGDYLKFVSSDGGFGGGAFQIDNTSNGPGVDFVAFCLQELQHMNFTFLFLVESITDYADDASGPDPIDPETAWIFWSYLQNQLTDFSSTEIQVAIWVIEGEWTSHFGRSASIITLAEAAVDAGWTNPGVRSLNLTYGTYRAQDQLVFIPAPEPASLTLVGGALACAWARRKLRNRRHRKE
jgi:hypothetical protein